VPEKLIMLTLILSTPKENSIIFVEIRNLKSKIMEEKAASIWKPTLTTGVYIAIVMILLSVVFYVTGNPFSKVSQYLTYPIMIGGVIWAQLNYKKALGGTLTYRQGIASGVLAMAFASLISSIYSFILFKFIDPSLTEQLRIFTEEQIIKQGRVPEEQLEMAVEMATKFQTPTMMLVFGLFGGAFMGLIISLITSIFIKKNPSDEVPA
jgi:hypothetical protein